MSVQSGGALQVGGATLPVSSSHALVDNFNYDNSYQQPGRIIL